jgi:hypothetical protein
MQMSPAITRIDAIKTKLDYTRASILLNETESESAPPIWKLMTSYIDARWLAKVRFLILVTGWSE